MEGGRTEIATAYRAVLPHLVAGGVTAALARMRPVKVSAGVAEARIGINRRLPAADGATALAPNPDAPIDRDVHVLRFDTLDGSAAAPSKGRRVDRGNALATIVVHACHPSSLEATVREISADYPGTARGIIEDLIGGTALMLQGAAGDIDPIEKAPDWNIPLRLGTELAAAAAQAALSATPLDDDSSLAVARERVAFPLRLPSDADAGRRTILALNRERDELAQRDASHPRLWWIDLQIETAQSGLDALIAGATPTLEGDVSVLRIGAAAICFNPAELFSAIGARIKRSSPLPWTAVVGYTDGALWYVPTRDEYERGGYEVDVACRVAPEAGDMLEQRTLGLLHRLVQGPGEGSIVTSASGHAASGSRQ